MSRIVVVGARPSARKHKVIIGNPVQRTGTCKACKPCKAKAPKGKLSAASRKSLPDCAFADPAKRRFPVHDKTHAAVALARLEAARKAGYVSSSEYPRILRRVEAARKEHGIAHETPSGESTTRKSTMKRGRRKGAGRRRNAAPAKKTTAKKRGTKRAAARKPAAKRKTAKRPRKAAMARTPMQQMITAKVATIKTAEEQAVAQKPAKKRAKKAAKKRAKKAPRTWSQAAATGAAKRARVAKKAAKKSAAQKATKTTGKKKGKTRRVTVLRPYHAPKRTAPDGTQLKRGQRYDAATKKIVRTKPRKTRKLIDMNTGRRFVSRSVRVRNPVIKPVDVAIGGSFAVVGMLTSTMVDRFIATRARSNDPAADVSYGSEAFLKSAAIADWRRLVASGVPTGVLALLSGLLYYYGKTGFAFAAGGASFGYATKFVPQLAQKLVAKTSLSEKTDGWVARLLPEWNKAQFTNTDDTPIDTGATAGAVGCGCGCRRNACMGQPTPGIWPNVPVGSGGGLPSFPTDQGYPGGDTSRRTGNGSVPMIPRKPENGKSGTPATPSGATPSTPSATPMFPRAQGGHMIVNEMGKYAAGLK